MVNPVAESTLDDRLSKFYLHVCLLHVSLEVNPATLIFLF
jgi:hypothetical protein